MAQIMTSLKQLILVNFSESYLNRRLATKPRTRAPIWHPDVCKIARHRSERLRMSILRKEGEGGGITRGN